MFNENVAPAARRSVHQQLAHFGRQILKPVLRAYSPVTDLLPIVRTVFQRAVRQRTVQTASRTRTLAKRQFLSSSNTIRRIETSLPLRINSLQQCQNICGNLRYRSITFPLKNQRVVKVQKRIILSVQEWPGAEPPPPMFRAARCWRLGETSDWQTLHWAPKAALDQ
jgi:hypothetical protein